MTRIKIEASCTRRQCVCKSILSARVQKRLCSTLSGRTPDLRPNMWPHVYLLLVKAVTTLTYKLFVEFDQMQIPISRDSDSSAGVGPRNLHFKQVLQVILVQMRNCSVILGCGLYRGPERVGHLIS